MNSIDIPTNPRDGFRNRKGVIRQIVDELEEEEIFDLPPEQELEDTESAFDLDAEDLVAVDVHLHHQGIL